MSYLDALLASARTSVNRMIVHPTEPTVLAPMLEASTEVVPEELLSADDVVCQVCGGVDSSQANDILLCDTCPRGFHMLCLPRPLATVPDGEWTCHICEPQKLGFTAADEHKMAWAPKLQLWAEDKKGQWGKARVVIVKPPPRPEGDGDSGASSSSGSGGGGALPKPSPITVKISFSGFSAKYDEWIEVGVGKLRPLEEGPKCKEGFGDEYYVMEEVLDRRMKNGRTEYMTTWEGWNVPTWEPKSSFVGPDAKRKLESFLLALRDEDDGVDDAQQQQEEDAGAAKGHAGVRGTNGASTTRGGFPCAPTPPLFMLPRVQPLPESRSWTHLSSNHPVADQQLTFVPWLGDEEMDRERMLEVEMITTKADLAAVAIGAHEKVADAHRALGGQAAAEAANPRLAGWQKNKQQPTDLQQTNACEPAMGQGAPSAAEPDSFHVVPHAAEETLLPLSLNRSVLSSLFCRRCFVYDCMVHPLAKPRPRWHYAPTRYRERKGDAEAGRAAEEAAARMPRAEQSALFAPLADYATVAPPSVAEDEATAAAIARCTCKLAPTRETLFMSDQLFCTRSSSSPAKSNGGKGDAKSSKGKAAIKAEVAAVAAPPQPQPTAPLVAAQPSKAQGLTALQVRRKQGVRAESYGTGCDTDGPCDTSNPNCLCISKSNFCEAHCTCGPTCKNRWRGCRCNRDCGTKSCPCFAVGRECDPDVCGCHASNFARAECKNCMPQRSSTVNRATVKIGRGRPKLAKANVQKAEGPPSAHVRKDAAHVCSKCGQRFKIACTMHERYCKGEQVAGMSASEEADDANGANEEDAQSTDGEDGDTEMVESSAAAPAAAVPSASAASSRDLVQIASEQSASPSEAPAPVLLAGRCRNMSIQLHEQVPLLIGPSTIPVAGYGAFAPRTIENGTFLLEYRGELISQDEANRRGQVYDRRASSYLFDLNDVQVVDACRKGNRSRFLNHSENANAFTRILSRRGEHHIGIFAKRRVERGEEIFFDYRYDCEEKESYGFKQRRKRRDESAEPAHKRPRAH